MIKKGHDIEIIAEHHSDNKSFISKDYQKYNIRNKTRYYPLQPRSIIGKIFYVSCIFLFKSWKYPKELINCFKFSGITNFNVLFRRVYKRFPSTIKSQKYDIIHCHFGDHGIEALYWKKLGLLSGKLVTTFHGIDLNVTPRSYGNGFYKELIKRGDLFTVGSDFMSKKLLSLKTPSEKIIRLPMGVDTSKFTYIERNFEEINVFKFIAVGRLVEVKGFKYLLSALSLLKNRSLKFHCLIVGDGPLKSELLNMMKILGLELHVTFVGMKSHDDVIKLYHESHIFVLPSIKTDSGEEEGQGLVVAEASSTGLPVIASAVGGIPESIVDTKSGLLVNPKDPNSIANALNWCMNNKSKLADMGIYGRDYISKHYNSEITNSQIEKVYYQLAGS
jgi:colanic acid/amylovoran biosynthesis glycosyltransferase